MRESESASGVRYEFVTTHQAFSPASISSCRNPSMQLAKETAPSTLRGGGSESESVWRGLKVVDTCEKRIQHLPAAPDEDAYPVTV